MPAEQGSSEVVDQQKVIGRLRKVGHALMHRKGGRHSEGQLHLRPEQHASSSRPSTNLTSPNFDSPETSPSDILPTVAGKRPHHEMRPDHHPFLLLNANNENNGQELDSQEERLLGCGIKAIESVLGAKATVAEKIQRIEAAKFIDRLTEAKIDTFDNLVAEDFKNTKEWYESLRLHETELGEAMRKYELAEAQMTTDEMRTAIINGRKIIIMTVAEDRLFNGERNYMHLMHVGYNYEDGNGFSSLSDGYPEIALNGSMGNYHCLVFDEKP